MRIVRTLLLALGSLLVSLVVAELVVRQFVENPITGIERTRYSWKVHGLRNDELLEYSFEPGVRSRMVLAGNYDVPFRISAQGLRDDVTYDREHPGVVRILLVGDSFVFGVGVELQDTIGKKLEAALEADPAWGRETEVVAVGVPSYGLDSYAKVIERWRPRVDPDVVLVSICPGNDLVDYEFEAQNPAAVVGGYLVSQYEAWSYNLRRVSTLAHMVLKRFNPHRRFVFNQAGAGPDEQARLHATMQPWIERIVAACAGPDGPPLAVTIMHGPQAVAAWREGRLGFNWHKTRALEEDFARGGALILDPKPAWIEAEGDAKDFFFPVDTHYTPAGTAIVAEYLARALRDELGGRIPPP